MSAPGSPGRTARQRRRRAELKDRARLDSKRLSWLDGDDDRLLDVRGYLQNEGGTVREAIDVLRARQGT